MFVYVYTQQVLIGLIDISQCLARVECMNVQTPAQSIPYRWVYMNCVCTNQNIPNSVLFFILEFGIKMIIQNMEDIEGILSIGF